MLFIIIGIVCFIVGLILIFGFKNPLGVLLFFLGFFVGFLGGTNISGYEEPVLNQEYKLGVIYEPDTYIIQDSSGAVTCKHVIESNHPEAIKSYGKYTYNEDVEIVVTKKGSKPVMKKYLVKARKTIWTFAVKCDKTKYVFYVPENNIERWQNEHVN